MCALGAKGKLVAVTKLRFKFRISIVSFNTHLLTFHRANWIALSFAFFLSLLAFRQSCEEDN